MVRQKIEAILRKAPPGRSKKENDKCQQALENLHIVLTDWALNQSFYGHYIEAVEEEHWALNLELQLFDGDAMTDEGKLSTDESLKDLELRLWELPDPEQILPRLKKLRGGFSDWDTPFGALLEQAALSGISACTLVMLRNFWEAASNGLIKPHRRKRDKWIKGGQAA